MVGFKEIGSGVPAEQAALLKSRNFSIRPLSTAGHLDAWRVLSLVWQPILIFVFAVELLTATNFRYTSGTVLGILYYAGLFALLLFPVGSFLLVLVGIIAASCKTRVRASAATYWLWWPFSRLFICATAACLASYIGNHIWYNLLLPQTRMERMQAYTNVDPAVATSKRLQDAGIVAFSKSAFVDRARTGCMKDGTTFCVAPILADRSAGGGAADGDQHQDLFMAGVNCCDCPGEFRCGDWNSPETLGGLRVLESTSLQMYRKSAEKWASLNKKTVKSPTFFTWVADPLVAYEELAERGQRLKLLALFVIPAGIVLATVALNGILALLVKKGIVAAVETPPPPPGLGRALNARFLPHLHSHYEAQEEEGLYEAKPKYVML